MLKIRKVLLTWIIHSFNLVAVFDYLKQFPIISTIYILIN